MTTPVSASVQVEYKSKSKDSVRRIEIDSTGLKVFGEGEWKVKKHSAEKRRTWRKLHLAVDVDPHNVICISAKVSLVNVGDSEALPPIRI